MKRRASLPDDTTDRMLATIEAHRDAIECGLTRAELRSLLPPGGARNALDCALWELESRRARTPVWQLAGVETPQPLLTTFTVSANEPAAMAEVARSYVAARAIKLKLTGDLGADIERVQKGRAARPDVWLGVDANQGYKRNTLDRLLPELKEGMFLCSSSLANAAKKQNSTASITPSPLRRRERTRFG